MVQHHLFKMRLFSEGVLVSGSQGSSLAFHQLSVDSTRCSYDSQTQQLGDNVI